MTIVKGSVGINNSSIAVPVDLQYSNLDYLTPLPTIRTPKMLISTIVSAASVVAGGNTGYINLGLDGTESEVYIMVNTDKQPWTLYARNIMDGIDSAGSTFPNYASSAVIYPTLTFPAIGLLLGHCAGGQGIAAPTTMAEAKAQMFPYSATQNCRLINGHATDTATVTIRVLRVWR